MITRLTLYTTIFLCLVSPLVSAQIQIDIDPEVSVLIQGERDLDRSQFINLSDLGSKFENKISDSAQVDHYTDDLQMNFGRELGGGYGVVQWNPSAVSEDVSRPGYADIPYLEASLYPNNGSASAGFINKYSPNLGTATHDRDGAYPAFMPTWSLGSHSFPINTDAAGEWIAGVLEHNYTDWTRPATYEIINEPDYHVWNDQRFANLHMAVNAEVDAAGLDVAVGGPCLGVAHFYENNYQQFRIRTFINNTSCSLDFYSFHVYDYMGWNAVSNDFHGHVSTGLPMEGMLDLVQNYTVNTFGKHVDIVLSEHGGYITGDEDGDLDTVANTYFPYGGGTPDFAWELKRRSVREFISISSMIANTMVFMNNPHVVRKAVPFVLLESAAWDPDYYSTLLIKEDFNPGSSVWHESKHVYFYDFFQDVSGRRVQVEIDDPDIQCQSYVNTNQLYVLLNNLADQAEPLTLNIPTNNIQNITLRRVGRNSDFTPYYTETNLVSLAGLQIESREALAITVDYTQDPAETTRVNVVPYYGDLTQQSYTGSRTFTVDMPDYDEAESAQLRIGVGRGVGTDHQIQVTFNGTPLTVPLEDCAHYLEYGAHYGTTKFISVPTNLLQMTNSVDISFPSGSGGIGSVVVRAAMSTPATNVPPTWSANPLWEAFSTQDTAYSSDLSDNASDENFDSLVFAKVSGPAWLNVSSNGVLSGTPGTGDVGVNSWTVSVSDGIDAAVETALFIVVSNVNDPPTFIVDPIYRAHGQDGVAFSGTINGTATDVDPSDTLSYSKDTGPAWLNVASDGTLSGTPGPGDVGANVFTVKVEDAALASDTATLSFTVIDASASNSLPTWTSNPFFEAASVEDVAYNSSLTNNVSDADSDPLTFAKVSGPTWLTVDSDGSLSGTPLNSDVGLNAWTVSVSDSIAPAVEATMRIAVGNVNDAPVFTVDPINKPNVLEGDAYSETISGSATDEDTGDTLTYSKDSGPSWLSVAANGALSGTPGAGDVGTNVFTVMVEDPSLASDTATLNVIVDSASTPSGYDIWAQQYSVEADGKTGDSDLDGVTNLVEYVVGGNPTNSGLNGYEPNLNESMQYVYVLVDDPLLSYQVMMTTNMESGFSMTNTAYLGSNTYSAGFMIHSNTVDTTTGELFLRLNLDYSD